ncbi:MAG: hypothetical protein CJD30_09115 [Sulfuricurvum sp. PD_MW2]|jgi:hypothetical protein|uniref:hypothetical protein n=1 Tax=Sulfuricurvum sp. PD_MW2 TaxID=2027917 RepID=UPI000C05D1F3|nr:hypothetical protein [Sulfuricurvum sp. PD_MW2]PHM16913.1 MAG: hypothetical protein CJD30_09115 [Sulfuricurvum sp. PD_MW2]
MQTVTVPKEVIWVTRLTWIWLIVNVIVNYTLSGHDNLIAALIYLMVASTIIPIIWVINYFLKKANKWIMWIFLIVSVLVILLDISTLLFPSLLTTEELEGMPSRIIRIIFGSPIVYLLLKKRSFFK